MNPYEIMREFLRLSQVDLAKRAQVTDQFIRRLEQGTIAAPNGRVTRALFDYAHQTDQMPALRDEIKFALARLKQANPTYQPFPPSTFQTVQEFDAIVDLWWHAWVYHKRFRTSSEDLLSVNSVYGVCRALCLHPATVQRWVKKAATPTGSATPMPLEIKRALATSRISHVALREALTNAAAK